VTQTFLMAVVEKRELIGGATVIRLVAPCEEDTVGTEMIWLYAPDVESRDQVGQVFRVTIESVDA